MGQNLGYTYSQLPNIGELLISKEDAERQTFDRVIDTNGRAQDVAVKTKSLVDINSL
jgi:hypothetical protein